jgi:manganese/iron transport system ATP-binding protein
LDINKMGISAKGLTVTYPNGKTALKDSSFEVPMGTITALVGVNGAGKSTLFKAIMGFVPVKQGVISVLDMPVKKALKNNLVAYVPQSEEIDWSFPVLVGDVVMMGRYGHMGFFRRSNQADKLAVRKALERVDMFQNCNVQIGELSGGQRKRVFLARALAQDAKVILLDEPFTGIDVRSEDEIIKLLREMKEEGRVMLISTHNLGSVPEFCDRSILIKEKIIAHGPTETTFTRENLEIAFGGVLRHFVIGGSDLNNDENTRKISVITDDEKPFFVYNDDGKIIK